jgi:hypothetical protein
MPVSPTSTERRESLYATPHALFFRVDDFDSAPQRARALVPRLEEDLHVNTNTRTREFSLRVPDGYDVTIGRLSLLHQEENESRRTNKTMHPTKASHGTKPSPRARPRHRGRSAG